MNRYFLILFVILALSQFSSAQQAVTISIKQDPFDRAIDNATRSIENLNDSLIKKQQLDIQKQQLQIEQERLQLQRDGNNIVNNSAKNNSLNHSTISINMRLWLAAAHGDYPAVKLYLNNGASINHREERCGYAPIHVAAERGHLEIVQYLITNGAAINAKARSAANSST